MWNYIKPHPDSTIFKFKEEKINDDMRSSFVDLPRGWGSFLSPELHDVSKFTLMDEVCPHCGSRDYGCLEIELPKDREEYDKAKVRMRGYIRGIGRFDPFDDKYWGQAETDEIARTN